MLFFFRTYKKAPLATFISFLGTLCFGGATVFSVGYFMDWGGLKSSGTSAAESFIFAAISAALGFVCWKLAAWLAKRKYDKMAGTGTTEGGDGTPSPEPACPRCGAKPEPGDVYCVECGAKLRP